MGNTCKSMADSFQCMTKPITIRKKKKCLRKLNVPVSESTRGFPTLHFYSTRKASPQSLSAEIPVRLQSLKLIQFFLETFPQQHRAFSPARGCEPSLPPGLLHAHWNLSAMTVVTLSLVQLSWLPYWTLSWREESGLCILTTTQNTEGGRWTVALAVG